MDAFKSIKDKMHKRHVEKFALIVQRFVSAVHNEERAKAEDALMDIDALFQTMRHGGYAEQALQLAGRLNEIIRQMRQEGMCDFILSARAS